MRRYDTDDGDCLSLEVEHRPDGTRAERRFHRNGAVAVERLTRDDRLQGEVWSTADGLRYAEVSPCDEPYVTKKGKSRVVERWRCVDTDGRGVAEGFVRPGLDGGPVGRWRLLDATGAVRATVKFKPLRVDRSELSAAFVQAMHTWREMPLPAALSGVDGVPWKKLDTWEGDARNVPFLLKGLAVPHGEAFGTALNELWNPILRQNTVSEAAGPAFRYLVALAGAITDAGRLTDLLDFLVRIATREGMLGGAHEIKRLHAGMPANVRNPVKYFHDNGTEGAYHEIYAAIDAATPTWAALSTHDHAGVRRCALHLLMCAAGEPAAQELRDRLTTPDRLARAEILVGLALHDTTPQNRAVLETFLSGDDDMLRFCAALTWVRLQLEPGEPAVRVLIDALAGTLELDGFQQIFLVSGSASAEATMTLALLPEQQAAGYSTSCAPRWTRPIRSARCR
ncbi:HEAT repeat domain-containing protein [Micromonospora sp. NPDC092111]|uniref:HEAT repeat domain-containing protein n=1 Tax=Micromonospora sp. NPDC092111 TaxID=3364289 RepID=UPI003808D734